VAATHTLKEKQAMLAQMIESYSVWLESRGLPNTVAEEMHGWPIANLGINDLDAWNPYTQPIQEAELPSMGAWFAQQAAVPAGLAAFKQIKKFRDLLGFRLVSDAPGIWNGDLFVSLDVFTRSPPQARKKILRSMRTT
jgi:hypothetical protein